MPGISRVLMDMCCFTRSNFTVHLCIVPDKPSDDRGLDAIDKSKKIQQFKKAGCH